MPDSKLVPEGFRTPEEWAAYVKESLAKISATSEDPAEDNIARAFIVDQAIECFRALLAKKYSLPIDTLQKQNPRIEWKDDHKAVDPTRVYHYDNATTLFVEMEVHGGTFGFFDIQITARDGDNEAFSVLVDIVILPAGEHGLH